MCSYDNIHLFLTFFFFFFFSHQSGDAESELAWQAICDISRLEFNLLYERLDIKLTERGESFYNQWMPQMVERVKDSGLSVESDGALCVFTDGFSYPFMVQKADGGYALFECLIVFVFVFVLFFDRLIDLFCLDLHMTQVI